MDSAAADPAMADTLARGIGYWVAGFVIPMLAAYVPLRLARSPTRGAAGALMLRILAILVAAFLTYAGYVGNGGRLNLGSLLACVVVIAWAIAQPLWRRSA